MRFPTITEVACAGKRVLIRADFNTPLTPDGRVADETRLRAALPTLRHVMAQRARVILMSHLGRPKGTVVEAYRLAPVARRLAELVGVPVAMAPDCIGPEVERRVAALAPGEVVLLENLRFHPEEEANDPAFARQLARLGDLYVDDAFGAVHRAHASVAAITECLPSVAGLLLARELEVLSGLLTSPPRPFVCIMGGAKVSDKIGVFTRLAPQVDTFLIGGGMAYTFLKARGVAVGASLVDADRLADTRALLDGDPRATDRYRLPTDHVVAQSLSPGGPSRTVSGGIPDGWLGVDLGPSTTAAFEAILRQARTVLWNGPVGVFEVPAFRDGTARLARCLAESRATTVIGGGDTARAVTELGLAARFAHISTGGGATLEFLEGKELPGVAALARGLADRVR